MSVSRVAIRGICVCATEGIERPRSKLKFDEYSFQEPLKRIEHMNEYGAGMHG